MEALDISFIITDAQGFDIPDADKIAKHAEFFNRLTITPSGCWEPDLSPLANGYVLASFEGVRNSYVHRTAYELYYDSKIKKGHEIHHKCRNRKCACPTHLESLTRHQHMLADGVAKLTPEDALDIYNRVWAGEMGSALALEYGIGQSQVSAIKRGKQWASVTQHAR